MGFGHDVDLIAGHVRDEDRLFALFPNLGRMPDRRGAHLSGGEQQMLTVARTLMGNPLVVLLDEPSEGVAPVIVAVHVRSPQLPSAKLPPIPASCAFMPSPAPFDVPRFARNSLSVRR